MRKLRSAFTIIEILVSVIILSISILYVLQIHTSNHEQIIYISERNKYSLEDSLYLTNDVLKYHKDNKSAYEVLEKEIEIKEFESRKILKDTDRSIFIPEEIRILPPPTIQGPTTIINEVKLKGTYSSIYWHIKLQGL